MHLFFRRFFTVLLVHWSELEGTIKEKGSRLFEEQKLLKNTQTTQNLCHGHFDASCHDLRPEVVRSSLRRAVDHFRRSFDFAGFEALGHRRSGRRHSQLFDVALFHVESNSPPRDTLPTSEPVGSRQFAPRSDVALFHVESNSPLRHDLPTSVALGDRPFACRRYTTRCALVKSSGSARRGLPQPLRHGNVDSLLQALRHWHSDALFDVRLRDAPLGTALVHRDDFNRDWYR